MVHFGVHHEDVPHVVNHPCQHAFVLVGHDAVFGVHMTQYHDEVHKYQCIFRLTLPEAEMAELRAARRRHPGASFVLCNAPADPARGVEEFAVPELAAGARTRFTGNVFFGFREPPKDAPPGWFPWDLSWTIPMLADVEVTVEHVVLFRPFAHHEAAPPHPACLIWGKGSEAHLTNLQTGTLLTGPFEPELFGIDYDHVMSLASAPDWLEPVLLEAGIVVSLPAIDRYDADDMPMVLPEPPWRPGDRVETLYRGIGPVRPVVAGPTYLWASVVCNSPALAKTLKNASFLMTAMPREYWKDRPTT